MTWPSNWRSDDRVDKPRETVGEVEPDAGPEPRAGEGRSGSGGIGAAAGLWADVGLVLLNKLVSGSEKAGGILRAAVHPDLVMQVDACGTAGRPHSADTLAERNALTRPDGHGIQMSETGLETTTMVYLNGVAIP